MDFGKSLCVLCRRPLAQAELVAAPSDCPTHYFHFDCLAQHASRERICPIDRVPFDNIVCEDGDGVDGAAEEEEEEEKIKADTKGEKEKEKEKSSQEAIVNREQENVNTQPSIAGLKISRDDDHKEASTGQQKFMISNEPIGTASRPFPTGNSAGNMECAICKRNSPGEMASPRSCDHWFHRSCLQYHLKQSSVCPVRGCHREVSTYVCLGGETRSIEMTVECEYRNMISAPDGFECGICNMAEIGRHRAVAQPCGHMFHRHCLTDFVREQKKCPTCQSRTTLLTGCTAGDLRELHFD